MPVVGEPPEWNAEQRVEDAERGAVQETEVRVGNPQVALHVLRQYAQNLAVDEVDHIDQHEHAERVPGIARRALFDRGGRRRFPTHVRTLYLCFADASRAIRKGEARKAGGVRGTRLAFAP